jgi:hypothetical protein
VWCVDGDSHFKRLRLEWTVFDKPEQQEEKLTSSTVEQERRLLMLK